MSFDVEAFRALFPSLASGIAHFDGPGGTQTPTPVAEAVAATLTAPLSNRGSVAASERNADEVVAAFRAAYADLLGVPAAGIVYGRSATQLTYDFAKHLAPRWGPGDEIVLTRLDHDCNVRPWVQAADRAGATVRWLELDQASAELNLDDLDTLIGARTRLVALTAAANLVGSKPPVAMIAERAHRFGALVWVDGVHYAAHTLVDLPALRADFLVCSPYKFLGPHCGVLAADPELLATVHPEKLAPSTDAVPERFEFGTLPYEAMAGATAAVDVLAALAPGAAGRRERLVAAWRLIEAHEHALRDRLEQGLAAFGARITVHSRARDRTPTILLTFAERSAADAYPFLADRGILAPAGSFYAVETATALGLGAAGGLRVGIAPYSTAAEVDRLLDALAEFLG